MPISELKEEVESIKDDVESIKEDKEKAEQNIEILQENIGVIKIYKEIIRSNKQSNTISLVAILMLFILVIILIATLLHNQKEFTAYRENSITKGELIDLLKEQNSSGDNYEEI